MMLYILRHAAAVAWNPGTADASRPLTPRGIRRMQQAAAGMSAIGVRIDRLLTSPCTRARQTAQIVARVLPDSPPPQVCPDLAPSGSAAQLIVAVSDLPAPADRVMLVGHEPALGRLISTLLTGSPAIEMDLRKAGLCCLRVDELRFGKCAVLKWFVTGRLLRAMARTG
jgi:phosphohistidine phosphatase